MSSIYSICHYCNQPAPLKQNIPYVEIWKAVNALGGVLEKLGSVFMVASGLSIGKRMITTILCQNKTFAEAVTNQYWDEYTLLVCGLVLNYIGHSIQYHVDLVDCRSHNLLT